MGENDTTRFSYTEEDFNLNIQDNNIDSQFDVALKAKWSKIEESNVLRYSVKSQQGRVIEGKYRFYAQLNTERALMRRKPEEMTSMLQPFDPNRFNFMKISHKEILFDVGSGEGNDVIAVNDSPIIWSHCLLLPQRFSGLPQQVTLYSFQKAIEILLLSNSENLRILFNSLCANASVNHLHWHLYYLNHRMLLESTPLQYFVGSVYTLEDFPAKGFCIRLSSFQDKNIHKYVSYSYKIISCLHKNQIPYNIYITRSKTNNDKEEYDDIRTYIWARVPSYGVKNTEDFVIAACEVFGHLQIRTKEAYERLNEEYVSECLRNTTEGAFLSAREKITKALQEESAEKTNGVPTAPDNVINNVI